MTRRPRSLVFFHIPKCGGTSATAALRAVFPRSVTDDGNLTAASLRSCPGATDVLFHGHAHHGAASHVPGGAVTATLLRSPVEQAVSNYRHLLRDPALPLHGLAVELGFARLIREHWQLLVFQAISLDVAISPDPIGTPEMFFARLPAIRSFLDRMDVVGHLDHLPLFVERAASRCGRPVPAPARHLNAAEPDPTGADLPAMRTAYASVEDDPLLRRLVAAETALVDHALRRARGRRTLWPIGSARHGRRRPFG